MSHAHAKTIIYILLFTTSSFCNPQIWGMVQILGILSSAQTLPTNNADQQIPPIRHTLSIDPWFSYLRGQQSKRSVVKHFVEIQSLLEQCIGKSKTSSCTFQTHASLVFAPVTGIIEHVFKPPTPLSRAELVLVNNAYALIEEVHENGMASVIVDYKAYGLMQRVNPLYKKKAASLIADYAHKCIKHVSQNEITRFVPPQILKNNKFILFDAMPEKNEIIESLKTKSSTIKNDDVRSLEEDDNQSLAEARSSIPKEDDNGSLEYKKS